MTIEVFSYTKVKGITIGDVINVGYDKHDDTVIVVEDKGGRLGSIHHTFGSKAKDLLELVDALESYNKKKYLEKEVVFDTIRRAVAGTPLTK